MSKPVDIIMATFGARDTVNQALTALYEHDAGLPWSLHICDSAISEQDGTRDLLREWEDRATIHCNEGNLAHWRALDRLAKECSSEWFVTLDSDTIILSDGWLRAMRDEIASERNAVVYGEMTHITRRQSAGPSWVWMPRVHPYLCGVNLRFFRHYDLSFSPTCFMARFAPRRRRTWETDLEFDTVSWTPPPPWFLQRMGIKEGDRFLVRGDTGWQLAFTAMWMFWRCSVLPMSQAVREKAEHLAGASLAVRADAIRQERKDINGRDHGQV